MLTKKAHKELIDLNQNIEDFKVMLVKNYDEDFLRELVQFDQHVFDDGSGMNAWGLVPLIRHGKVFILWSKDLGIIGSAALMKDWENKNEGYFYSYAISPKMQGKGLGSKFFAVIAAYLKQIGLRNISLTVDPNNEAAIKVYEKLGFKIFAMHESEYGEGLNRYIMKLELHREN